MNTDQAHLLMTYFLFVVFLVIAIGILAATLSPRVSFCSISTVSRISGILLSIFLFSIGFSCLAGISTVKHDTYYLTHRAPWPGAIIFTDIAGIAFVPLFIMGAVASIKGWINSPRYD